ERTVYAITDAGRAELEDWARELLATVESEQPRFQAALSVMAVLTPDDATDLLARRLTALTDQIRADREQLSTAAREVPRLFLVENEYALAILEAEAEWRRALVAALSGGTFPDLAQCQPLHTTV